MAKRKPAKTNPTEEVLKRARDEKVHFICLWFSDLLGNL